MRSSLNLPEAGISTIGVAFHGLGYGAPLLADDPGVMVNGDGASVGTTGNYRSEERRGGTECSLVGRSRGWAG